MTDDPTVTDGPGADLRGLHADEITDRIHQLCERWDDPPIETWQQDARDYESLRTTVEAGYLGGAYAWVVRDPADTPELTASMPAWAASDDPHVLMILGRGATDWGLPGGGRETGESFEEAAVREVDEEVGIDCELTACFLLRRVVCTNPDGEREPIHFLQVFFDAGYRGGTVTVQGGELNGAAWFETPPPEIGMNPANERRAESFFH